MAQGGRHSVVIRVLHRPNFRNRSETRIDWVHGKRSKTECIQPRVLHSFVDSVVAHVVQRKCSGSSETLLELQVPFLVGGR
jgi:hypothetical protein